MASVGARDVTVIRTRRRDPERGVPVRELEVGDLFVVRAGETVPTDGEVLSGRSGIDRSVMTGESVPVDVIAGDEVIGGTVAWVGS